MSTEPRLRRGDPGRRAPGAFGLAVASEADLPGLDPPAALAGLRRAEHRLLEPEAMAARLARGGLTPLGSSGGGQARISYLEHSSGATLIRTTGFGEHLVADRGGLLLSAVGDAATAAWQRYVLGQLLPLAASIQGLEIFHAGGVAIGGGVVALAGPSGAGKSSLAAALIGAGAGAFFADDVLALEATSFGLTAYPGPGLIGVPHDLPRELVESLPAGRIWTTGERKVLATIRGERRALPVRAFVRLTPDERVGATSFAPCLPDRLMATTFDGVSRAPERLLRLLRVAAQLAAEGNALELRYRPRADPREVAQALLGRLGKRATAGERAA